MPVPESDVIATDQNTLRFGIQSLNRILGEADPRRFEDRQSDIREAQASVNSEMRRARNVAFDSLVRLRTTRK